MNLHKPIFYLLFIISLNIYGQTTKWQHLVRKNTDGNYFLVKTSGGRNIPEGHKVIRVLDREYVITHAPKHTTGNIHKRGKNKLWSANDLWKVSPNTGLSRNRKMIFIIKTSDDECLKHTEKHKTVRFLPDSRTYLVRATAKEVKKHILPLDCVTYVGMESLVPVTESSIPDLNLTVNNIAQLHREAPGQMGQDMVVSIKDDMYDPEDIDLTGKHLPSGNESSEVSAHATAMATLAAGLGNSSANGKGAAPEARISSSDFNVLYPDNGLEGMGVSVQNHSYGTEIENFYGILAREYDAFLYENPTQVHLFSSGNLGNEPPKNGLYSGIPGYANLTGNFKMAKNILTVGALDAQLSIPDFSSKGPAHDGRIKPDLSAFSSIGTSNANALVSGVALLLQQYYRGEHQGSLPPASLIKALLINGADDLGSPGPDYRSGYGNVNALQSHNILRNGQFITDKVGNAGIREYTLEIPENAINIKATLNWTDLPAEPNSNIALVNDLDMTISHNGTVYEPWVLDHTPDEQALNKPATKGTDHLNNTEQVFIPEVTGNQLIIRVDGYHITGEEQPFSIAYSWEKEGEFHWINPVENGNFPHDGASADFIRWKTTFHNTPGTLDISYDKGSTWESIATGITPQQGYLSWDPVENEGSTALLRMTIENQSFTSPPFVISYTPDPGISLKCNGTTEVSWRKNIAATAYDIFSLQNNTMTFTERITDTTYITDSSSSYFAVAPVYQNGTKGIRSQALNVSESEEHCYWESLYTTNEEGHIRLYFSLGSTYLAERIEVFKVLPEGEERIQNIEPVNQKKFEIIDNTPLEGANVYRAKLILEDGSELYSETVNTIYLSATPFLLFPNPVTSGGLNIYSKKFRESDTVYIYLYSADGKFMMKEQLISDRDFISLERLTNGAYYYKIEVNGKKMRSGGLILHHF
ncbi:S8 family serine peptidase [Sinomicrobium weinanense]|uniref:S8 family serine peptidase n=1 Tax=Sinomicrobium weinanense TaxID=2842200 RepID=A0A926JUF1_9FLAO|nr:S8 family serine peptidase [Sinomicrobium weinanense]MBC9797519.1 S8 family serine peptidase [Sinomicrobium weinanense]MBU3122378.1 S8 family serine peptidase [Sinomicrobium weinanense]